LCKNKCLLFVIPITITSVNTSDITSVCTYFLHMYDIILVGDDIVKLLS